MSDPPPPPPSPSPDHARIVLARIVLALGVAAALSSGPLVEAAANRPYGPARSALVAVATGLQEQAAAWQLDAPDRALRSATGRPARLVESRSTSSGAPLVAPSERPPSDNARALASRPAGVRRRPDQRPTAPEGPAPPTIGPPAIGSELSLPSPDRNEATTAGGGRLVTPTAKLRLWAGGDSLGEYVGHQLLDPVTDQAVVEVELDYRISTGLARPDYFDWPARIADIMAATDPPEALVFMVGGNDNQPMEGPAGVLATATPAWFEEYRLRVGLVMDTARAGGAQLFWIGLPPMRDGTRNEIAVAVNDVIEQEAVARPDVTFLDIEILFSGPGGTYSPTIADPAGRQRVVRAPDGVHITYVGSTWVADRVWELVRSQWRFGGGVSEAGQASPPAPEQLPR